MNKKKKKMFFGLIAIAAIALIIGLTVAFMNKPEEKPKKTKKPAKTEVEKVEEPVETKYYSILTGLPVSKEEADRRPFAIMTENTKDALPQYGLNSAGVIYEAPAEGGITRLMAVYESTEGMDRIGNVRSCRPYYAYISAEYDAVYVHFGQSPEGQEVLDTGIVEDLNGLSSIGGKVFFRSSDKKAPHNAYTSDEGLKYGMEKQGYATTFDSTEHKHFNFAPEGTSNMLANGTDCKKVSLYFFNNKPDFVYDDATGLYNRFEFGNQHIDARDGNQIAVKNIILQNVTSSKYNADKGTLNLGVIGSGSGKFLTNGKCIDITWERKSEHDITRYFDASGNEIELNPGKTWISIIEEQYADSNVFSATAE